MEIFTLFSKLISLIIAIIGFNLVTFIHEFGHFIFCKIFGVETPVFSIGMGKALASIKLGKTVFQFAAIPIGGFVAPFIDEENPTTPGNFNAISYPKKLIIISAGVIFNLLGALTIYTTVLYFVGMPNPNLKTITVKTVDVSGLVYGSIKENDEIIGINNHLFEKSNYSLEDYLDEIRLSKGSNIKIRIVSEGKEKSIEVSIPENHPNNQFLGITCVPNTKEGFVNTDSIIHAAKTAFNLCLENIKRITSSIYSLIKNRAFSGLAGPVTIIKESFAKASTDLIKFGLFLAFLSINLALLNILPFGVLDGGKLLSITIQTIFGPRATILINIIDITSAILLGGLALTLTVKELSYLHPITNIIIVTLIIFTTLGDYIIEIIKKLFNK